MAIDPSKISLKGFFLDPNTSTVGGTRNIFSNGVMCAKIYLGFSYNAANGDASTVRDVVNWLLENGALRSESGNQTDDGTLEDNGWTDFGNTDPNNHEYVFDTQVVVLENEENWDQLPGNAIWHMGYFLRAPENGTTPLNVYYRANDPQAYQGLTTLHDNLMIVKPEAWDFIADDFVINDIEAYNGSDGTPKSGRILREINYRSTYDDNIYGLLTFYNISPNYKDDADPYVPFDGTPYNAGYPENNVYVLYNVPPGFGNAPTRSIYLLNKLHSGLNISTLNVTAYGTFDTINGNINTLVVDPQLNDYDINYNNLKGIPIGTQKEAYFWGAIEDDPILSPALAADYEDGLYIYAYDTFGSRLKINIDLLGEKQDFYNWRVISVIRQSSESSLN